MKSKPRNLGIRKLGRVFLMLKWLQISPGLKVETLAMLVDVSIDNIYRYVTELRMLGISIKDKNGCYTLESDDIIGSIKLGCAKVQMESRNDEGCNDAQSE